MRTAPGVDGPRRRGRWLAVTCAVAAAGIAATTLTGDPASGAQNYYVPVTRKLTVYGHGYGHGHGMSQYGAEGAARQGRSYREILAFYYPGTELGKSPRRIRVLLTADTTSDVAVRPSRGLSVRDLTGRDTWALPGDIGAEQWRITPKGSDPRVSVVQYLDSGGWHRYRKVRALSGAAEFVAERAIGLVRPDGSVARYRGALRSAPPYEDAKFRDTVNVLRMDDYVRGVIADEMPASWSQPALRSQAVAARTYASYMQRMNKRRYYQICDTTSCQVYGGVGSETPSTTKAVRKTRRKILRYEGKPALTQFSSSNGGWSSAGSVPYLAAKADPFDGWDGNPNASWSTTIEASSLESRYPEMGRLESFRVTKRDGHGAWGGRVLQVTLVGSSGTVRLTGDDLRWAYGLKSTYFTFELTPIMRTWKRLGGRKSPLGRPESAEHPTSNAKGLEGAVQEFSDGRALWSQKTGARALYGPILERYRKLGAARSWMGYPRTTILGTHDGGQKARFQRGAMWSSRKTGAHELRGKILKAYQKRHAAGSALGYPLTKVYKIGNGLRARFQGGRITWLADKKKIVVDVKR